MAFTMEMVDKALISYDGRKGGGRKISQKSEQFWDAISSIQDGQIAQLCLSQTFAELWPGKILNMEDDESFNKARMAIYQKIRQKNQNGDYRVGFEPTVKFSRANDVVIIGRNVNL